MAHSRGHSGGAAQFHRPEPGQPVRAQRGGGLCEGNAAPVVTCCGCSAHRLPYLQGHWHPHIPAQQRQDEVLPRLHLEHGWLRDASLDSDQRESMLTHM